MLFKNDWEETKKRFDAFWDREYIGRCFIAITAPRAKPISIDVERKEPKNLKQKWLDPEFRLQQQLYTFAHTYYGGEAFPCFFNNLGPGVLASFITDHYVLGENTVWFDRKPIIKDWSQAPSLDFNEESNMWQILKSMTEEFSRKSENRYFTGISDLGGNLDIAASLRGTEPLLMDLIDHSQEITSLLARIDEIWFDVYQKLYKIINRYMEGTSTWLQLWCRERWYPLQCDFSTMISSDLFAKYVKPALSREADFLDKAIYHLDGPEEIKHLDHILDIPGIYGIEWVPIGKKDPVTGQYYLDQADEQWYPLYKKIQGSGKNLILRLIRPQDIKKLLDNVSAKGLFITTSCSSEEEARELITKVKQWSQA